MYKKLIKEVTNRTDKELRVREEGPTSLEVSFYTHKKEELVTFSITINLSDKSVDAQVNKTGSRVSMTYFRSKATTPGDISDCLDLFKAIEVEINNSKDTELDDLKALFED